MVLTPILILIFFLLRRQLHPPDEPEKPPPKVLVIYNVNCGYHVKVVKELMNYLQDICNIEVLLDEQSIPDSDTKVNGIVLMSNYRFIVTCQVLDVKSV